MILEEEGGPSCLPMLGQIIHSPELSFLFITPSSKILVWFHTSIKCCINDLDLKLVLTWISQRNITTHEVERTLNEESGICEVNSIQNTLLISYREQIIYLRVFSFPYCKNWVTEWTAFMCQAGAVNAWMGSAVRLWQWWTTWWLEDRFAFPQGIGNQS